MSLSNVCKIEQIVVYPVKSLRGITVNKWPLTPQGLRYDRQWMLVMPSGRFVTQRQLSAMALIDTAIEQNCLHLSAVNRGSVSLPLTSPSNRKPFSGSVWRDECEVIEASEEASAWLNQVLSPPQPLRLVTMSQSFRRTQSEPERFGSDTHTLFADAAPFLVANRASLDKLNHRLMEKGLAAVDMRRFRPNIIISGVEAFSEHRIQSLRGNNLDLNLCDHCQRCIITTIDPDTGEKSADMEPFNTLIELNPMPDNLKAPAFGVNATLINQDYAEERVLAVGDSFSVVLR